MKHICGPQCVVKNGFGIKATHPEIREWIEGDLELDPIPAERLYMEIVRARNHDDKERTLLRMFQSTLTGQYYIRIQSIAMSPPMRFATLEFDSYADCAEYYNECVEIVKFDTNLMLSDEQRLGSFFADEEPDFGAFGDDPPNFGAFGSDEDEDDEPDFGAWGQDDEPQDFVVRKKKRRK